MNGIRNILTRETKAKLNSTTIFCDLSRNKNTLIIKSTTEENLNKLMKTIEEISSLKHIIELTYKSTNLKKLIILGIPSEIAAEEVINNLNNTYETEFPITIVKTIARNKAKNYQLVIESEDWIARHLLHDRKLQIGFNTAKVSLYLPIIRCNQCQAYGHTNQNCRRETICQYCARFHSSSTCPNRKNPNKHRCVNCIGTPSDFPHTSNSTDCPSFQFHIERRNTLAQQYLQNSMN